MSEDPKLEAELIELDARIAEELSDPDERPELARALAQRARLLGRLGRFAEADEAFAAVLSEFELDVDPVVAHLVLLARFNRAIYRDKQGESAAALETIDSFSPSMGRTRRAVASM
jgi:hypothetical protein